MTYLISSSRRILLVSAVLAVITLIVCSCAQNSIPGGNQDDDDGSNVNTDEEWVPIVNLQITENANVAVFDAVMSELRSRNITATIIVDEFMASAGCSSLQTADLEGHEIMIYGRPDEPDEEIVVLEMLSYEEQEEVIQDAETAIEICVGKDIKGFRSYHFSQNEDTYAIVDSLGIEFNLSFVAHTYRSLPGHENDTLPYHGTGYDFWAVPMHSIVTVNGRSAFCDMPFKSLSDAEWEALLISEFDTMASQKRPLLVEIHPYFSAVDPGRFNAIKNFLDYAVDQGTEFITGEELVEWSEQDSQ